jgi:hypothetical protein
MTVAASCRRSGDSLIMLLILIPYLAFPGNSARPPREGQLRLARIGSIRIEAHLAAALLLRREQRPARLRSGGAEQRATAFGLVVSKEDVLGAGMGIAVAPLQDAVAQ